MFTFDKLEGKRIELLPLQTEHLSPLFQAARDPQIWELYPTAIRSEEDMQAFIAKAIEARERKEQFPFAVFDKQLGKVVGSTRFLRISEENNNLNIRSTWYAPEVWRTRVNTEAKYLMLRHAFETLAVNRVEIITTPDNLRSQRAIERLGAVREGIFRKKYNNRDYIIYSVIDSDWHNDLKNRLEGFLTDIN
ncbi:RimJ/RimL family protein N-acetyltransferase [Paenibacillus cellulosilyticus]|uniref:RimJ/RimL family protein N-acetyltransferase n=1 Tax=Paenibacillus cellulosilyticus TaxID=375489 RepID=A0A2V2YPW9_9BACL|nr:GNAT family protein [Paenibacillus cellulosilyticus]PWV94491.1 RimJ/RimL family protein N-acetyltransferase [Paenibacillus cellulosilyticus]QKS45003.1 GNAT family N-acetyltransferase [Paenibacillus cellulosilyticus]